jgi:hypothetical protein
MDGPHLECLPDECLAKTLGHSNGDIYHHNDKGRVCRYMQSNKNVVGMVDEDPNSAQPPYLRSLKEVSFIHNIRSLEDSTMRNRLVVLCPRLEEWIIKVCDLNQVDITQFGLSKRGNDLHREINGKLKNLESLILHLRDKKAPEIKHLDKLLKGM